MFRKSLSDMSPNIYSFMLKSCSSVNWSINESLTASPREAKDAAAIAAAVKKSIRILYRLIGFTIICFIKLIDCVFSASLIDQNLMLF